MSNLELKGGILQMIASVNDSETLAGLKEIITVYIGNHIQDTDYWNELSDVEKTELEKAIAESENEDNLVNHEVMMQKYNQWLSK